MINSGYPAPGDVIDGKYRITEIIAAGGMGTVLRAQHVALGSVVALKFSQPDLGRKDPVFAKRFLNEARVAAQLANQHLVRVSDFGEHDGVAYMVMECLRGSDLSALLTLRQRLPVPQAVGYVLQACEGIAVAHAAGIVHRDLKPANLFLCEGSDGETIKVLDFGIAKTADIAAQHALTRTHMSMGTPYYMSPEQILDLKNTDARGDIWALGAILFELLSGRRPFDEPGLGELWEAIRTQSPPSLVSIVPDIPAALEAVVMRCLEKDRTRRPGIVELGAALIQFGPEGSRASVDRIARYSGVPFVETGVRPPNQETDRPQAWGRTDPQQLAPKKPKTRRLAARWLLTFLAVLVASAFLVWARHGRLHNRVARATASAAAASVAPSVTPAVAAASTVLDVTPLGPASGTPSPALSTQPPPSQPAPAVRQLLNLQQIHGQPVPAPSASTHAPSPSQEGQSYDFSSEVRDPWADKGPRGAAGSSAR